MRSIALTLLTAACLLAAKSSAQCSAFGNSPPGTNLQLGDDGLRTVGLGFNFRFNNLFYSEITICANGFVWLGEVHEEDFDFHGNDWFDNEQDFLDYGPRIAVAWDDWNPAAFGAVYYRTDATSCSIVWQGIPRFGGFGTLNAELVLTSSSEFFIKHDATAIAPSDSCIVGYSRGGGAAANPLNWSAALPTTILASTGYELFGPTGLDLIGQIVQCTPTAAAAIDHAAQSGTLSPCPPGNYPPLSPAPVAFGLGCPANSVASPSAIYELFTPTGGASPTDLSNQSITLVKAGNVYLTAPGPGLDTSYLTQGTPLNQFDETIITGLSLGPMGVFPFCNVHFPSIDAAANGYLVLQPGAISDFSPSAGEFLAQQPRIAPHWSDYDLTFGGTFYWQNNNPAFCMATWNQVEMFAQPGTSNTFQVKLWANGDLTFSYGSVASAFDDVLVGITLGHGGVDPGSSDLSNTGSPVTRDLGALVLPLTHTASGPAAINTTLDLIADNLNGGNFGVFAVGSTPTDIDVSSLGMTGCRMYVSLDELYFGFTTNGRLIMSFFIPPTPALFGVTAHTQAAMFAAVNPFGLINSNRLTHTIGL